MVSMEAFAAMQTELEQSQGHITSLAQQIEGLRAQERMTEQTMQSLRDQIVRLESRGTGGFKSEHTFLNMKTMEVKTFAGAEDDNIKPWAKRVTSYLNARYKGMKDALKWSMAQEKEIEDLSGMNWEAATQVDEPLYEYLTTVASDKALTLIESVQGRGFEAWR